MIAEEPRVDATRVTELAQSLENELARLIVGQKALLRDTVIALTAGGHVLLEGVPGLGKTVLVRSLGQALSMSFARIQFTPDLMPADIVGTNIIGDSDGRREFHYQAGPIFANLVLADEINRATPKTQSALLEAMQERTVTVGTQTRPLPSPFFVLATQNPIELEGTYPLPEAQLDRFFFKILVPFPPEGDLLEIARRTTGESTPQLRSVADAGAILAAQRTAREVPIAEHVLRYAARLVSATHPDRTELDSVRRYVRWGASPRGLQTLVLGGKVRALLEGRYNVAFDDLNAIAQPALRHRIFLQFEAEADGITADRIISEILEHTAKEPAAQLFARLQSFPAGGVTNYERLVWPIGRQRPGMSVLITDGLGEPAMDAALSALQRAHQEGAVLQLLAPQEITPDWSGDARLKDAETGLEREFTATPLTQGAYVNALAQRTTEIERAAHRRGLRFARLSSAEPIDEMVQRTLRRIGLLG